MELVIASHLKTINLCQRITLLWDVLPFYVNNTYPKNELLLCEEVYAETQYRGESYLEELLREADLIGPRFKNITMIRLPTVKYTFTISVDDVKIEYDDVLYIKSPSETRFYLRPELYTIRNKNEFIYYNQNIVLKFSYTELILNEFRVPGPSNNYHKIKNNKVYFNDEPLIASKKFHHSGRYKGYVNIRKNGSLDSIYISNGTNYHVLVLKLYDNGVLKSLHSYQNGYLQGPFIFVDSEGNVTEGYYENNLLTGYFRNSYEEGNLQIKNNRFFKVGLWYVNGEKKIYHGYAERFYPVVTL